MLDRLRVRSIRPPEEPNSNPPGIAPASVGPPDATGGDPHQFTVEGDTPPPIVTPTIVPSSWDGYPDEWDMPRWGGRAATLANTAWTCIDLNASVIASMEPYTVGSAPSTDTSWMQNPNPDFYASWEDFCKSLFWDYMATGEVFVMATGFYSTGWPARFGIVPPWAVQVDLDQGFRRYRIGSVELQPNELLHIRYQGSVDDARGHGPLEAVGARVIAAEVLAKYARNVVAKGMPPSVLTHEDELDDEQAAKYKAQWIAARMSSIGEPAVLSGGMKWSPVEMSPKDMALVELTQWNESRISVALGVPPFIVGLPSGGDSMTYANVNALFDYHWRAGLRPKVKPVMAALSEWLLPRGTQVTLNQDAYVEAGPKERAETAAILAGIVDAQGNPVLTVQQIQEAERISTAAPEVAPLGG